MIIELAAGAALLAAASALTRFAWARQARNARERAPEQPATPPPRGLGLFPGDVVVVVGEEHVLERAAELDEGGLVLRVFEVIASPLRYLVQLDLEGESLLLARPSAAISDGRVADVVEHDGRSLSLIRRGQALARAVGPGSEALLNGRVGYVVLGDRAGRRLVVLEPEGQPRLVLLGDLIDRRMVDLLPGH